METQFPLGDRLAWYIFITISTAGDVSQSVVKTGTSSSVSFSAVLMKLTTTQMSASRKCYRLR